MKITGVETYPVSIPLKCPFRISLGESITYEGVLIKILTNRGIYGIGEAAPSPRITGETTKSILSALERFTPILIGMNPLRIDPIMDKIESNILYNPSAKCAVDIALHDISGKVSQKSLKDLLGGKRPQIETDITIGIKGIEESITEAREIISKGFRIIKLKIGEEPKRDIEKIRILRDELPDDITIRVDANQGYTVKEAIDVLEELTKYRIELIEQPVKFWDIEGMKEVRRASPLPVMADESLHTSYDATRLIREEACDYFNIKLMKVGGIMEALKIASIAEDCGIMCMIGCMGETEIGITAALHFALSTEAVVFADLDSHLTHTRSMTEGGIIIENGLCRIPETPGIGVEMRLDQPP